MSTDSEERHTGPLTRVPFPSSACCFSPKEGILRHPSGCADHLKQSLISYMVLNIPVSKEVWGITT